LLQSLKKHKTDDPMKRNREDRYQKGYSNFKKSWNTEILNSSPRGEPKKKAGSSLAFGERKRPEEEAISSPPFYLLKKNLGGTKPRWERGHHGNI